MTTLSKRDLLLALAALGAAAAPAMAQSAPLDLSAGRAIGEAYLAANPAADIAALRRTLLPDGATPEALHQLHARVARDFRETRVFTHAGWRLSETEAQLFALLARA